MTTNEILNDYMTRAISKEAEFKKLLKVSKEVFKLECNVDDLKQILKEREELISSLSQQLKQQKELNSLIKIDCENLTIENLELKKMNKSLINGL